MLELILKVGHSRDQLGSFQVLLEDFLSFCQVILDTAVEESVQGMSVGDVWLGSSEESALLVVMEVLEGLLDAAVLSTALDKAEVDRSGNWLSVETFVEGGKSFEYSVEFARLEASLDQVVVVDFR